ncbi:MAG: hypothetical protein ACE5GJ_09150 [Gemmatimonadota bacterium]
MPGSSSDCGSHLSLLNTLLAFTITHPRFPSPLKDRGYDADVLIEWEFSGIESGIVSFDAIVNNSTACHALLIEVKSSAGDDEARKRFRQQLDRHRLLTNDDVRGSGVTLGEVDTTFDLAVMTRHDRSQDLLDQLDDEDPHSAVVLQVIRDDGACCLASCELQRRELSRGELQDAFTLELDPPVPIPDHFMPFDQNSSLLETAAEILPALGRLYLDPNRMSFSHEELAEASIPVWPSIHKRYQRGIATRVRTVLRGLEAALGDTGFRWDNSERAWIFKEPPDRRRDASPPTLNRQVLQVLAREWDLEIEQLDVFEPPLL